MYIFNLASGQKLIQDSELNKWHMDNLITHMAAITLYIDGFKTDTNDLREDLRLENKQYVFSSSLTNIC